MFLWQINGEQLTQSTAILIYAAKVVLKLKRMIMMMMTIVSASQSAAL